MREEVHGSVESKETREESHRTNDAVVQLVFDAGQQSCQQYEQLEQLVQAQFEFL